MLPATEMLAGRPCESHTIWLFAANQRPAVDIGLSVSRVGGKAQPEILRAVAGRVRLDYAQFLEMKMFARFGGFADGAMKDRLARGERIAALLAQERYAPLPTLAQAALLAALADGALDVVPVASFPALKAALVPILAALPVPERLDDAARAALVDAVRRAAGGLAP